LGRGGIFDPKALKEGGQVNFLGTIKHEDGNLMSRNINSTTRVGGAPS